MQKFHHNTSSCVISFVFFIKRQYSVFTITCRDYKVWLSCIPSVSLNDGCYGKYAVLTLYKEHKGYDTRASVVVELLHDAKLPFGPLIEGASFSGLNGSSLIVYGFRGENFIVWDETSHREILNVKCGGAHRSYAFAENLGY